MNYGRAIKMVRSASGLTQSALAERLSIGASQLSLVESGKRQPTVRVLGEIAEVLRVPPHLLTLLGSNLEDLNQQADSKQIAELARALLDVMLRLSEQPSLPLKRGRSSGA